MKMNQFITECFLNSFITIPRIIPSLERISIIMYSFIWRNILFTLIFAAMKMMKNQAYLYTPIEVYQTSNIKKTIIP